MIKRIIILAAILSSAAIRGFAADSVTLSAAAGSRCVINVSSEEAPLVAMQFKAEFDSTMFELEEVRQKFITDADGEQKPSKADTGEKTVYMDGDELLGAEYVSDSEGAVYYAGTRVKTTDYVGEGAVELVLRAKKAGTGRVDFSGARITVIEDGTPVTKAISPVLVTDSGAEETQVSRVSISELEDEFIDSLDMTDAKKLLLSYKDESISIRVDGNRVICETDNPYGEPVSVLLKAGRDKLIKTVVSENGKIIFEAPVFGEYQLVKNPRDFSDNTGYGRDIIAQMAADNIISGRGDGRFCPDDTVTKAEYVKMLTEAFGAVNEELKCTATDVSETDWFYPYAASFEAAAGAVGYFGGGEYINRSTAAELTGRILYAKKTVDTAASAEFSDTDEPVIKNLAGLGIISGFEDGSFRPWQPITRREAAVLIYKAMMFYLKN